MVTCWARQHSAIAATTAGTQRRHAEILTASTPVATSTVCAAASTLQPDEQPDHSQGEHEQAQAEQGGPPVHRGGCRFAGPEYGVLDVGHQALVVHKGLSAGRVAPVPRTSSARRA